MAAFRIRHAGLKLMSVVLASLLWLLVSGEQTVERSLRVPLEFTNLPPQLELLGEPPAVVDVRLRGASGTMTRVSAGELAAVLDVRTARPGQRLFHLTTSDVRAPFGVSVVQVAPATLPLTFEASVTKLVPVAARVEGEPAPGFVVGAITVEPARVDVVGPASVLADLRGAITEPVSVAGARGTVTEEVTIGVAEASARLRTAARARVSVTILPAPEEWVVSGLEIHVRNAPATARLAPKVVAARVRGPRAARYGDILRFTASVDAAGLTSGRHVLPVVVEGPPGVDVVSVDPLDVTLTVR